VADVGVDTARDQRGGFFEGQQAGGTGALFGWMAAPAQGFHAEGQRDEAGE